MRSMMLCLVLPFAILQTAAQWLPLTSGVTARLRGVSAVSAEIVWASGANGTVVRSGDGGKTWQSLTIPGGEKLDFRDVDGIDAKTAYALSIGPGEASRIYKTVDAGASWNEQFVNRDPKAFFDAMAFWDAERGIAVSDSVDGQFVILRTGNGGRTWERVAAAGLPAALPNEGFFAASGTNVATVAPNHAWIATGAASESRVLRSSDGGATWQAARTPLPAGPSSGIFSVAFADARRGIVVGGDYKLEAGVGDNAAITADGGATWTLVKGLTGFRSAVAYLDRGGRSVIAVGPAGSDLSRDGGTTWTAIPGSGFHTVSVARRDGVAFGAGEKGAVGRLVTK